VENVENVVSTVKRESKDSSVQQAFQGTAVLKAYRVRSEMLE